jgi:hypothetical protein
MFSIKSHSMYGLCRWVKLVAMVCRNDVSEMKSFRSMDGWVQVSARSNLLSNSHSPSLFVYVLAIV